MSRTTRSVGSLAAVAAVFCTVTAAIGQSGMFPPTEAHKQMAREAGVWDAEMKLWMDPEGEPVVSKGTETNSMLGDYWLESKFEGEVAGQKFVGKGTTGYDPQAEKFVGTWYDTMTPYLMTTEGEYDVATHTLTMTGQSRDPATGEMSKSKLVVKYVDDDTKVMEMHGPAPGGGEDDWFKMMEISYKRKK